MPAPRAIASADLAYANKKKTISSYTGYVAGQCQVPTNFNATNKQVQCRTRHIVRDDISELQLVFANFYVPAASVETGSGADMSVTASVEYPAGIYNQVRFGGSASGTIPNGGIIVSDALAVPIPEGAEIFVITFAGGSAGIVYENNTTGKLDYRNGEGIQLAASGLADQTMGGFAAGFDFVNRYGPVAIIGQTKYRSWCLLGDSRTYGQGDVLNDRSGDIGELARAIGAKYAYSKLCVPGDSAVEFVASNTQRRLIAQYASDILIPFGINDLFTGRTSTQIAADLVTIASYFPTHRKWTQTVVPTTTSTDNWLTTANQTIGISPSNLSAMNTARRAVPASFAGCFEVADQVMSDRNSSLWRVSQSAAIKWLTVDGTHQTEEGYRRTNLAFYDA